MSDERNHTDAETIVAFLHTLCIPLAREIVSVMAEQGFAVPGWPQQSETQSHSLVQRLHERLRSTEDDLAAVTVERDSLRGLLDTSAAEIERLRRRDDEGPDSAHDAEAAAALDAAIEHEDALPPAEPATAAAALLEKAEVCRLAGIAPRTVVYLRSQGKFPAPAARRGVKHLWRRGDITAWLAARTGGPAPAGEELLDVRAVAARIGCTPATLYTRIHKGEFPKHTHTRSLKHYWTRAAVDDWRATRITAGSGRMPPPPKAGAKTCATCADRVQVGRNSVCRSQSSRRRHKVVQLTDTCDWHRKPSPGPYRPARQDEED